MTRVGRTRVALLLAGVACVSVASGCGGGGDFKDKPRPAVPIDLSGVISNGKVDVEPNKLGAGPINLLISNQTKQAHTVTLEGGPNNTTEQVGPINPLDTGRIQETLEPGTYTVKAGSESASASEITPAKITVGPKRPSSSDRVLLP